MAKKKEPDAYELLRKITEFVSEVPVKEEWIKRKKTAQNYGEELYSIFQETERCLRKILPMYREFGSPCIGGVRRIPPI